MISYPPEFFSTFPDKFSCGSYSDFYQFGRFLNSLIIIKNDPTITKKIGYLFSYLINGTFTFYPKQRLNFTEVEKYFNFILDNYDSKMGVMRHPHDNDGNVPTWFYKSAKPENNSDYKRYVKEYKACNFKYVHFIIDSNNSNLALPKYACGKNNQMEQLIVYEFQQGFPFAISLPQTNHQKKYFFGGSLLLFEQGVFCYAEFHDDKDEDKIRCTIATYNYLDIVKEINSRGIEYIKRIE